MKSSGKNVYYKYLLFNMLALTRKKLKVFNDVYEFKGRG